MWLRHNYPWSQLVVLRDGTVEAYAQKLEWATVIPPPENPDQYRRLLDTLEKQAGETRTELRSPVDELLIRDDEGNFESFGCEDQELREDLLEFMELKAQNLSSILDCGPLLELGWTGPVAVDIVCRGPRALLSISGDKGSQWSQNLKDRLQDEFGKSLA
jgi:hypothetical protein